MRFTEMGCDPVISISAGRNELIHRLGYIPPRARPRPGRGYRCSAEHWVTGRVCKLDGALRLGQPKDGSPVQYMLN
jgi:hypothetical protein